MLKRLKEPSTYAGIAAAVGGVSQIFGYQHGDALGGAMAAAAQNVVANNYAGVIMAIAGFFAIIMKENSKE